jgi:rRNA biogenesis protein RRP5
MPGQKRSLDGAPSARKVKKSRFLDEGKNASPLQSTSNHLSTEIDFPRGGGTSFTPLELKTIRAEAVKEAERELFAVRPAF